MFKNALLFLSLSTNALCGAVVIFIAGAVVGKLADESKEKQTAPANS